jgi:hypothetical protein
MTITTCPSSPSNHANPSAEPPVGNFARTAIVRVLAVGAASTAVMGLLAGTAEATSPLGESRHVSMVSLSMPSADSVIGVIPSGCLLGHNFITGPNGAPQSTKGCLGGYAARGLGRLAWNKHTAGCAGGGVLGAEQGAQKGKGRGKVVRGAAGAVAGCAAGW